MLEKCVWYDWCIFLARLCRSLSCFILYSKTKLACYSKYLLTSYICSPIPYDEKAYQVAVMIKNPPANAGDIRDMCSIPESGRSPGGGHGNSLQYSCLYNSRNRGAWWATVQRVAKGQTWLKWLNTHTHVMKRTSFLVLVLKDLVGLHRTIWLQLLQHLWLEYRLGLLWCWVLCLKKRMVIILSFLRLQSSTAFQTLDESYSISSMGFLPTIVDIMVIWIKFTHSHPF